MTQHYLASDQGLLTELGDGTGVLLDMQSNFYFTLNDSAIFLWKLLSAGKPQDREALARAVVAEFEVELADARRDVDALLALLARERLVKVTEAITPGALR